MKSYTDLKQSKTLAKILPLESVDMNYWCGTQIRIGGHRTMDKDLDVPCWSLAALLGALEHPRCFQGDKPIYWFCGCLGKDKLYHEVEADNPVDACYEMIIKLHELKLL